MVTGEFAGSINLCSPNAQLTFAKEGKRREKKGKEGKRREKKGKEGKRREKKGKAYSLRNSLVQSQSELLEFSKS